jgi:hypothetical protein
MNDAKGWPVRLHLEMDPDGLKKVVEEGRLLEFVNTLAANAAGRIKIEVVDQLTKAGVGATKVGAGLNISFGFDIDDKYGTRPPHPHPHGPWPWPWPWPWAQVVAGSIHEQFAGTDLAEQIRQVIREELGGMKH